MLIKNHNTHKNLIINKIKFWGVTVRLNALYSYLCEFRALDCNNSV